MLQLLSMQSLLEQWSLLQITGALVLFAPVVFFTGLAIKYRYFHPLSKFPGPFFASISPLYAMWVFTTEKEHIIMEELHKKYGPIVRYQPDFLIFADPKMIPVIYHRHADKTEYANVPLPGEALSVVSMIDHKKHAVARKRVASPYSMTAAREMESMIDVRIKEWMDIFNQRYAQTGAVLDYAKWSQYFAYDVISEIAFGEPFGFMETNSDVHTLIKSFHVGLYSAALIAKSEWIKAIIYHPFVVKYLMPDADKKAGFGRLCQERDKLVSKRLNSGPGSSKKTDLLGFFLNVKNADGSPMSIPDVKAELLLVMFAGSDTTAASLRGLLINVLQTPGCYEKLMEEINGYTRSHPGDSIISFDDAQNLKYLTACLKESMRHSTSTPTLMPRAPAKGGLTLEDGRYIPENTMMTVNSYITQRNKEVYGEDADEFVPERWLESEAKVRIMEKYDVHFGAGARTCLGKNIAYLELWKGSFEFFRNFKPTLVAPEKIKLSNWGLMVHKDLWVRIEKRV